MATVRKIVWLIFIGVFGAAGWFAWAVLTPVQPSGQTFVLLRPGYSTRRIAVELRYDKRQFRLTVRDNGIGIDDELMSQQRAGHFGLHGMRERAEIVGGRLEVWSKPNTGTEVELSIPRAIAYGRTVQRTWFSKLFFGKRRINRSTQP